MRILGIDPGSAVMGFGVVDWEAGRLTHVVHGTLRPSRNLDVSGRLHFLFEGVQQLVQRHEPNAAAVEQVFVSVSPRSALVLGQARGAALAAVGSCGITLAEYSASQIKQSTTGNGRAAKAQVQNMIKRLLSLDKVPATDAADALAAAICHANAGRLGRVLPAVNERSGHNKRSAGSQVSRSTIAHSPATRPPVTRSTVNKARARRP